MAMCRGGRVASPRIPYARGESVMPRCVERLLMVIAECVVVRSVGAFHLPPLLAMGVGGDRKCILGIVT